MAERLLPVAFVFGALSILNGDIHLLLSGHGFINFKEFNMGATVFVIVVAKDKDNLWPRIYGRPNDFAIILDRFLFPKGDFFEMIN